jgi:hypothetical protein
VAWFPVRLVGLLVVAGVLVGTQPGLAATVTLTVAALCAALIAFRQLAIPSPVPAGSSALRRRARRTEVVRLHDPDAAGRPRPRAPSVV